jgi:hypothetical protein
LSGLPAPFILTSGALVLADLAGGREPEGNGVIGNFIGAPVVGRIRYLDVSSSRRIHIDDVDAGAVARDDATARKRIDGSSPDIRVLRQDTVDVASRLDDILLALALSRAQLESRAFDDGAFDLDVPKS